MTADLSATNGTQVTGRTRICFIHSHEASASSAMRLSARRSRRQSSRLICTGQNW